MPHRIQPPQNPGIVGLVGAPGSNPTQIIEPPDNHASALSEYFGTATVSGTGTINELSGVTPDVMRAYWKQPTLITVQSRCTAAVDSTAPPGQAEFVWSRVRLLITYGDDNAEYTIDLEAGQNYTVIGKYCFVKAYLTSYGVIPRDPVGHQVIIPTTVSAQVSVSAIAGELDSTPNLSNLYSRCQGQFAATDPRDVPLILFNMTGYQESGADAYLMFFDSSPEAVDYSGTGGDNQLVANGDTPLYQFKVPSGIDFSVNFDDGFVFQHGLYAIWSSSPGQLTMTDPSEAQGVPSFGGAAWTQNFKARILNLTKSPNP